MAKSFCDTKQSGCPLIDPQTATFIPHVWMRKLEAVRQIEDARHTRNNCPRNSGHSSERSCWTAWMAEGLLTLPSRSWRGDFAPPHEAYGVAALPPGVILGCKTNKGHV